MRKLRAIILSSLCLFALSMLFPATAQDHNCDMAAVLAEEGQLIATVPGDPDYYFYDFIAAHSGAYPNNDDGYGVLYVKDGETTVPDPQYYYSFDHYGINPWTLMQARADIMDPDNEAALVMAHSRQGTGGLRGVHPFRFDWLGRTYAFMHNGFILDEIWDDPNIKEALWYDLWWNTGSEPGEWFDQHPSEWLSWEEAGFWDNFIDSELIFHWIMKNVIANDGSVLAGLYEALTGTVEDPHTGEDISLYYHFRSNVYNNIVNFVFSDGEALYVFRNTWDMGNSYALSWEDLGGYYAVKTQDYLANPLDQFELVRIPRGGEVTEVGQFLNNLVLPDCFISGEISEDVQLGGMVCLYDDVIVMGGAVVEIMEDAVVEFGTQCNFIIEDGELILHEGAEIRLGQGSQLRVLNLASRIFLHWGSGISGFGPGDLVVAEDNGLITTPRTGLLPDSPKIVFKTRSKSRWGGITIKYPRRWSNIDQGYYFWNCDFSKMNNFYMINSNILPYSAWFDVYKSTFKHSKQILVTDHHVARFRHSDYMYNDYPYVIDEDAQLNMYDSKIAYNGYGGVEIGETQNYVSFMNNSICNNKGCGVKSKSDITYFINNKIYENGNPNVYPSGGMYLGIDCQVTGFNGFRDNIFKENFKIQYMAGYDAFNWPNQDNTFASQEFYILECYDYYQQPVIPTPRPVWGNTFYYTSQSQFLPCFEAFDFIGPGIGF